MTTAQKNTHCELVITRVFACVCERAHVCLKYEHLDCLRQEKEGTGKHENKNKTQHECDCCLSLLIKLISTDILVLLRDIYVYNFPSFL